MSDDDYTLVCNACGAAKKVAAGSWDQRQQEATDMWREGHQRQEHPTQHVTFDWQAPAGAPQSPAPQSTASH